MDKARGFAILQVVDSNGILKTIMIDPHQMDALMYALNDVPEVYTDTCEGDYDTKEEYEEVIGYGNALKELYNQIVEVME